MDFAVAIRFGRVTFVGHAVVASLSNASAQMATFVEDDCSTKQVGPTAAGGKIAPRYSRNHTVWTVIEGPVATDGTSVGNFGPVAGYLNFGCAGNPTVTLPFGNVDDGPASIAFTQSLTTVGCASNLRTFTEVVTCQSGCPEMRSLRSGWRRLWPRRCACMRMSSHAWAPRRKRRR